MPKYTIGKAAPQIRPDSGSGKWCSAPQTSKFLLLKRSLEMAMDTNALDITIGTDAVKHMRHYMRNTGKDFNLDVKDILGKSSYLRAAYQAELAEAKTFTETLLAGDHDITSTTLGRGYFKQQKDTNLFFAIGGFSYWGNGKVSVRERNDAQKTGQEVARSYTLTFSFHLYDRYNWDTGKQVQIGGITVTDAFMQEFHKQCYAREFNIKGEFTQTVSWQKLIAPIPVTNTTGTKKAK